LDAVDWNVLYAAGAFAIVAALWLFALVIFLSQVAADD